MPSRVVSVRAAGLLLGGAVDALLADPRRRHPVAGFGWLAGRLERTSYRDSRSAGAGHTLLLVAATAGGAALTERAADRFTPAARIALTAAATWAVIGGTSLRREGCALGDELLRGDLRAARRRLPHLCGRDSSVLEGAGLARAGVESIAENTSDAVVAPLFWGALAGLPGLVGYRAVNTLDAMIGYRDTRYGRFGWAAARADDVANLLPARLCALLTCACAPVVGGSPADAYWVMRRDGSSHPSPNAGQVEAAFAGALGLRLGGELRYPHGVERRPRLGFGRPPEPVDLPAAARLSAAVTLSSLGACAAITVVAGLVQRAVRPTAGRRRGRGR